MAMAAHPRGFPAFHPTDHDLITLVLRPMAARHQGFGGDGGFIHVADVYSAAPETLAERYAPAPGAGGADGTAATCCWYFLCPARCRHRRAAAAGEGCWNPDPAEAAASWPVWGPDGRAVGRSRTLSYGARAAAPWAAVTRHGWRMVELALGDGDGDDQQLAGGGGGGGGGDFVLCKLFRSPPPARADEASTCTMAAASTAVSACKRKAIGIHPEAPPSVRHQLTMQRSF